MTFKQRVLTAVASGLDAVKNILGAVLLHALDDETRQVCIQVFLCVGSMDHFRLTCPGFCRAALDRTAGNASTGSSSTGSELGVEGLILTVSVSKRACQLLDSAGEVLRIALAILELQAQRIGVARHLPLSGQLFFELRDEFVCS